MGTGVSVPGATSTDVWAYVTRTLTRLTGTPRTDIVGADEAIYTRLDETLSGKLTFDDAIPATPTAGSFAEKFKNDLVKNNITVVKLKHSDTAADYWTVTDVGTTLTSVDKQFIAWDFTETGHTRIGFHAIARGNETGTKTFELKNETDGVSVASTTWSGTGMTPLSAFATVSYTGSKWFRFYWAGSSTTEDLTLHSCHFVVIYKP